jgi:hypothetical protein
MTTQEGELATMVSRNAYRRVSAAAVSLLAALGVAGPAAASDGGQPTPEGPYCWRSAFPHPSLSCMVHEPNVTQPATTYPIPVHPGDHVWVDAGGCVQTGGHGLTWRRYVDPQSNKDLYHGLIDIPGVTRGMQRIQGILRTSFEVFGDGNVILGYEDDGYADNGYYSHDDGTGGQCRNSQNAWVQILITSG